MSSVPMTAFVSVSAIPQNERLWCFSVEQYHEMIDAGIPIYWIVNLVDRCLEVFSNPTGETAEPDYQESQILADDSPVPLWIDGREIAQIAVRTLLP